MVNSSLDGDNLIVKHYYHIGFAADTPNGLVVPVIRDADKKTLLEIAREAGELARRRARASSRRPRCRAAVSRSPVSAASAARRSRRSSTRRKSPSSACLAGRAETEMGRQALCAAPDAAVVVVLRPPRGVAPGDALYCAPRTGAAFMHGTLIGHGCLASARPASLRENRSGVDGLIDLLPQSRRERKEQQEEFDDF